MLYTKLFSELHKSDANIAGGKGASLGEMLNAGIPVPDGFVVLSTTFDEFIKQAEIEADIEGILDQVDHKAVHTIDEASTKIQEIIINTKMPEAIEKEIIESFNILNSEFVAVRSSATAEDGAEHAWAGQLDSFLNTTKDNVLNNVRRCWASLFTPRAIFYRFEKGLYTTHISVAVVVQTMVNSEKSGIAFSVHPVTEDPNQLIIEAGLGLGEAIVSGSVTPDSYVVEKDSKNIIECIANNQNKALYRKAGGGNEWKDLNNEEANRQVLSEKEILELATIILTVENHYGFPCDLEWAYEHNKFFIVQSRPITTLQKKSETKENNDDHWEKIWERGLKTQKAIDYCRSVSSYFEKSFGKGLYSWIYTLEKNGSSAVYARAKEWLDFQNFYINKFANDKEFVKQALDFKNLYQPHLKFLEKLESLDLSKMSDQELVEFFKQYKESVYNYFVALWTVVIWENAIEKTAYNILEKHFKANEIEAKALTIFSLSEDNYLINEEKDLCKIAELPLIDQEEALRNHVNKYEYIPMYDYDYEPYDQEYFEKRLKNIDLKELKNKFKEIENNKKSFAEFIKNSSFTDWEKEELKTLHALFNHKDERSHYRSLDSYKGRKIFIEVALRLKITLSEVMLLLDEEIITGLLEGSIKGKMTELKKRQEKYVLVYDHDEVVFYTDEEMEDYYEKNLKVNTDENIKGLTVSFGKAVGKVKIIKTINDLSLIEKGDILVTSMTRPDYVSAMKECSAIITDEGSILCHAAIISRELKIPCVVGTKIATQVLQDGDEVEVDADQGVVKVIKNKNNDWLFMWSTTPLMPTYWATCQALLTRGDLYSNGEIFCFFDGNVVTAYVKKSQIYQAKKEGEKYLDKNFFANYLANYKKETESWWSWVRMTENKNYLNINLSELLQDFDKFNKFQRDSLAYFSSTRTEFTFAAEQKLEEIIKKYYKDNWLSLFGVLTTPVVLDDIQNEYLDWLKLLDRKLDNKLLLNHASRYPWLIFGQFDDKKVIEFLKDRYDNEKGNFKDENKRLTKVKNELKKQQEAIFKNINSDATEGRYLAKFIQHQSIERMKIKAYWAGSYYLTRNMWLKISNNMNLPLWDIIGFITPFEIKQFIDKQTKDIKDVIADRKKSHAIFVSGKELKIVGSKEANELFQEKIKRTSNDYYSINGQTAMLGVARGKVRKIIAGDLDMLKDSIKNFEKGEVLVTSMTQPNMMVLAKKAAAIVADEGGITSHAAIIARELKIPCIVGCLQAMQILNDGDEVEVDADQGIVRILNTKSPDGLIEEIIKTKWFHLGKWFEPALAAELWLDYGRVAQTFFTNKLDKKILYLNGDFFLSQHDSDIFQNETYEAAKHKNKAFFEKIYNLIKITADEIIKISKSADSIVGFLEDYKKLTGVWMPLNNIALGIEKYVQEINPLIFSNIKGFIDEKPWTIQQLDELQELQEKIEKVIGKKLDNSKEIPNEFKDEVNAHIKKYEWLGTHHFSLGQLTIDNLVERMKQERASANHDNLKKSTNESSYLNWLLNIIGYARFRAAEASGYSTYYFKDQLISLGKKNNLSYDDIVEHTIQEISSGNVSKEIVASRKENTGFYFSEKEFILSNEQIKECSDGLLHVESNSLNELKGQVAYKGKVTGKVKIVVKQDQIAGFENGMILVAYETTPDIIFAMQKSAAIITDFGGLTSHAAIIARELRKPCIVGTKIATQALQDGDEVEVDADKGVVKIINKKIILEKIYTRDTTIIMQELWSWCCDRGVKEIFGFNNPYHPNIIHYVNDGSIELWENRQATHWLMDTILEKNKTDQEFLIKIITLYKEQVKEIKKYWDKKYLTNLKEFPDYIKKTEAALNNFIIYYYSAVDERTPEKLRKLALDLREIDIFFATSDEFIRQTLIKHYPKIAGYETVVLTNEIENIPDHNELEQRRNNFTLINGFEWKVETLEDLMLRKKDWVFKKEVVENIDSHEIIKGQVAFKGIVRGPIKLLRRRDQVLEVNTGEIIVSPMTTPDFLPALKKAAGFITDEGGITCHAAIVARELKKPCLIGTKIATQVLQDGDEVELDADQGIVKIIQKKQVDVIKKATKLFAGLETSRQEGYFSLLIYGACLPGCVSPYADIYHAKAKLNCALLFVSESRGVTIFSWDDYVSFTKEAYELFITNQGQLRNVIDFKKTWKKINNWYKKYSPEVIKKLSLEENIKIINLIFKEYFLFLAQTVFCESLDETQIKTYYEKAGGDLASFKTFLDISSKPTFDSFALRQDEAIVNVKNDYEIQHCFTNYFITPTLEEVPAKYQTYIKEKGGVDLIKKEITNIKKELAESVIEVKNFRQSLPPKLQKLLDFIQLCMYLRDVRKEPIEKIVTLQSNNAREIFTKLGLNPNDAPFAYCEDFNSGLYKNNSYQALIAKRKKGTSVYFSNEEVLFEYSDVGKNIEKALELFDKVSLVNNELHGSIAYPGIVQGVVKIMHNHKDFVNFNEGDILVTSMTRPEFVPLMKRAVAVITDEGGVTCHAAIISRELKLPCITGTKNATRLLKDGDKVEVDANQGIVKIL